MGLGWWCGVSFCAQKLATIKTKSRLQNLLVRPRPPSYSFGQGPGRVPGPGLRGSWPWPASGRIRADRSLLVVGPGSHLELMAWPDGKLIAKAGAIFGAPVAICWCFFCDFLVLFCVSSFLDCVFFVLVWCLFGALAGKMAGAHFVICWCLFCLSSFPDCACLFCALLVLVLVLWLVLPFHINLIMCSSVLTHLVLFLVVIL